MTRRVARGRQGKLAASLVYPEFFPVTAATALLDIACGAGPQLATYAPGVRLAVGVDIQIDRLVMAQELVAGLQLTNSFVVVADAGALPLASSAFDRAIAIDVLEHLDEPRELLTEARRVLVDRGRLLVTVPALYDRLREGPIGDVVRRVKRRHRYFTGRLGFDDHRRPRELTEWESLFAETGFRVARSRATTLFPPLHRYGVPRFWFTLTPLRRTISALGTLPALRALGQAVMFDLVRC